MPGRVPATAPPLTSTGYGCPSGAVQNLTESTTGPQESVFGGMVHCIGIGLRRNGEAGKRERGECPGDAEADGLVFQLFPQVFEPAPRLPRRRA